MTNADMIEAMARAIYERVNGSGCRPWRQIDHKPAYRDQATAALAVVQPELDRLRAENEALRRVGNDALTILKFAFNRIHVLPRSRDTELANDIDKVLGRLRAALFAPALDGEGR